jgi:hypothetical protein
MLAKKKAQDQPRNLATREGTHDKMSLKFITLFEIFS